MEENSRRMHMNKTYTQDYTTPNFIKNLEKKEGDCHNSYVNPTKTPPKTSDKGYTTGRTPVKYKTLTTQSGKSSGMSKGSPEEEKKPYKTLD